MLTACEICGLEGLSTQLKKTISNALQANDILEGASPSAPRDTGGGSVKSKSRISGIVLVVVLVLDASRFFSRARSSCNYFVPLI
jgi:hypothetical protein